MYHHTQFRSLRTTISMVIVLLFALPVCTHASSGIAPDQVSVHFEHVFGHPHEKRTSQTGVLMPDNESESALSELSSSRAEFRGTWTHKAKIEGSDHEASSLWAASSLSWAFPLARGRNLSVVGTASNYAINETISDGNESLFGYHHLWQWDAGVMFSENLSPRWDLLAGGSLIISGGNRQYLDNSVSFLLIGGAVFRINPNLAIGGLYYGSLGWSPSQKSVPAFLLEWRINELSRLMVRNGLIYERALQGNWDRVFGLGLEMESWEAKVRELPNIDVNRDKSPFLQVLDFSVNVYYRHRFSNGLMLSTKLGVVRWADHNYHESRKEISSIQVRNAPGVSIGLGYRF